MPCATPMVCRCCIAVCSPASSFAAFIAVAACSAYRNTTSRSSASANPPRRSEYRLSAPMGCSPIASRTESNEPTPSAAARGPQRGQRGSCSTSPLRYHSLSTSASTQGPSPSSYCRTSQRDASAEVEARVRGRLRSGTVMLAWSTSGTRVSERSTSVCTVTASSRVASRSALIRANAAASLPVELISYRRVDPESEALGSSLRPDITRIRGGQESVVLLADNPLGRLAHRQALLARSLHDPVVRALHVEAVQVGQHALRLLDDGARRDRV